MSWIQLCGQAVHTPQDCGTCSTAQRGHHSCVHLLLYVFLTASALSWPSRWVERPSRISNTFAVASQWDQKAFSFLFCLWLSSPREKQPGLWKGIPAHSRVLELDDLHGPFQPEPFYDSVEQNSECDLFSVGMGLSWCVEETWGVGNFHPSNLSSFSTRKRSPMKNSEQRSKMTCSLPAYLLMGCYSYRKFSSDPW